MSSEREHGSRLLRKMKPKQRALETLTVLSREHVVLSSEEQDQVIALFTKVPLEGFNYSLPLPWRIIHCFSSTVAHCTVWPVSLWGEDGNSTRLVFSSLIPEYLLLGSDKKLYSITLDWDWKIYGPDYNTFPNVVQKAGTFPDDTNIYQYSAGWSRELYQDKTLRELLKLIRTGSPPP